MPTGCRICRTALGILARRRSDLSKINRMAAIFQLFVKGRRVLFQNGLGVQGCGGSNLWRESSVADILDAQWYCTFSME